MGKFKDLTDQRFGKLVVISKTDYHIKPSGKKIIQWNCLCDCGNKTVVSGESLKSGHTKSCGCNKHIAYTKTHGQTNTRLYKIWIGMKERCYNTNRNNYYLYGGKGIEVCDEWQTFKPFHEWAINNGYSDDLTIDRIDSNGSYEPSNCRWATDIEQSNNRKTNRIIEYNGESHTLEEWSKITGIASNTIRMRLDEYGFNVEKALTRPLRKSTTAKQAE